MALGRTLWTWAALVSEIVMESNSGSARLRLEPNFFLLLEKLEPKIRVF
jgi:hypothetical protein